MAIVAIIFSLAAIAASVYSLRQSRQAARARKQIRAISQELLDLAASAPHRGGPHAGQR